MTISSISTKRPTAVQLVRTSHKKENSASVKPSTQKCAFIDMLHCIISVERTAESEPVLGSVSANAAMSSPDASFGRYLRFCASLPASSSVPEPTPCHNRGAELLLVECSCCCHSYKYAPIRLLDTVLLVLYKCTTRTVCTPKSAPSDMSFENCDSPMRAICDVLSPRPPVIQ